MVRSKVTATVAEGYTLVICAASACRPEKPNRVAAALRECVQSSRHGVLIVSGCSVSAIGCRLRPAGLVVVVQPCDVHRRPTGLAVRVGPLRSDDDVAAVQAWIRHARFDPALLPPHLVMLHRTTRAAMYN